MGTLLLCLTLICGLGGLNADPIPEQPQTDAVATPPTYEHALGKMLLTLLGLIALLFFTVWIIRKLGAGRLGRMQANSSIKILEKRALSQKSILYLIEVDGKRLLVSESQLEVRALSSVNHLNIS